MDTCGPQAASLFMLFICTTAVKAPGLLPPLENLPLQNRSSQAIKQEVGLRNSTNFYLDATAGLGLSPFSLLHHTLGAFVFNRNLLLMQFEVQTTPRLHLPFRPPRLSFREGQSLRQVRLYIDGNNAGVTPPSPGKTKLASPVLPRRDAVH